MTATKERPKHRAELSDDQLAELLDLAGGADSVELKLTVPESDQASTMSGLGLDPLQAQIRQLFFFDTPDLALNQHGLVVRARRVQGRGDDSVVKLRPVVPDEFPDNLRQSPSTGVEVDAMPGGYVCSATMKAAHGSDGRQADARGERAVRKLFSKEQREFFPSTRRRASSSKSFVLGPIFVLKLKRRAERYGRKLVAEGWLYPDGSRILELSTKCPPAEMFQVAAEARAFLGRHGVNLLGEQQTKTKTALEYFARQQHAG